LINASNADTLTEYTLRHVTGCRGLILDLSGLDFFGTEGFSALHTVSACCAHAGTSWAVVRGGAVSRLLRICGLHAGLPAADTVEAALATFGDQPHRPPRLIASRPNPGQSSRCERTVGVVCGGADTSATNSGR
jgi:anti-anti-sigma factor